MAHQTKELMLKELEDRFQDISETGCVLIEPGALNGKQYHQLRDQLRANGGDMILVRNRLFALAAENLGVGGIERLLEGQVGVVRAENAVTAAKAVKEASKVVEAVKVRGGYAEGEVIDAAGVETLAEMPSREELLSMLLGQITAPARRLLGCIAGPGQKVVSCIKTIAEPEEEAAEASA